MKHPELLIPGAGPDEAVGRLRRIIELLRGEGGCPWDRAQTHDSLRSCLIEEAYEVDEAIEEQDPSHLEEELGDVLLQVIFHSDLGKEAGEFDLATVANRECEKMIRRHPHVFSNFEAHSIDTVLEKWENVKQKENSDTVSESMRKVPRSLPALRKSYKIQAKAADVGFDWNRVDEAFQKVHEETGELWEIHRTGDQEKILEEIGDLLFAVVNVARFLKVDPEDALNFTSRKFIRRFRHIEEAADRPLTQMTLDEMDRLWEQAKALERRPASGK